MDNFVEDLKKYFDETPKEKVLEDWNKSKEFDKVGPTVDEFINNTELNNIINMENYKLINKINNNITICTKVVVDGFDYYVSDNQIKNDDFMYCPVLKKILIMNLDTVLMLKNLDYDIDGKSKYNKNWLKKVLATNNQAIDLPKVIDKVEELALKHFHCTDKEQIESLDLTRKFNLWKEGYNKSQETHPFSEEDMIEFSWWLFKNIGQYNDDMTAHFEGKYFKDWKSQQPKILYYE